MSFVIGIFTIKGLLITLLILNHILQPGWLLKLVAGSIASYAQWRLVYLENIDLLYLHAVQLGENLFSGNMKSSYGW